MRYYVYVSETKVEQLYAQIPTRLRDKLATKLTIDLKLIKGEFEGKQPQESLFSKLDIVRNYLDDEGLIGTVDEPKEFFGGNMPLSWGPYGGGGKDLEFVYFGGRTEQTVVGLGGSLKHVIGEAGTSHSHSHSATPILIEALRAAVEMPMTDSEQDFAKHLPIGIGPNHKPVYSLAYVDRGKEMALGCVITASGQMGGPWELMEFVAKRLVNGIQDRVFWGQGERIGFEKLGSMKVILGTPLYVAMAE